MSSTLQEKQRYKETELGWIPEDWNVIPFGNILDVKSGVGFKHSEYTNDGVKLLRIDNVSHNKITWESIAYLPNNYLKQYPDLVLNAGDILLALNRPITQRKLKIARLPVDDEPSILYQRVGKILFLDSKVDKDFIYYLLSKELKTFVEKTSVGSDQPFISVIALRNLNLPVPEIKEQQKIAEILSTVDEKINNIDKKIEQAKKLKKGLMQELLTRGIGHIEFKDTDIGRIPQAWDIKRLEDITILLKDGTHGTHKNLSEGIPLLSAKDINNGKIELNNDPRLISYEEFQKIHRNYNIQENDILLTIVGTLGRTAIVKDYSIIFTVQRSVAIIRILSDLNHYFYNYIFQSKYFQSQLKLGSNASAQAGVYLGTLKNIKIVIPSIEEQQKIAEILNTADEKLETLQTKKLEYENLKKGLMQKLLTGRIRVKM